MSHPAQLSPSHFSHYRRCLHEALPTWGTDDRTMWELHHGSPFLPNARNQKLSNSAITQLDEIYLLIEKNPEQKKQETKSQNNSKKVKNTVTIYSWILSYSSIQKKKRSSKGVFEPSVKRHRCKNESAHYQKVGSGSFNFLLTLALLL